MKERPNMHRQLKKQGTLAHRAAMCVCVYKCVCMCVCMCVYKCVCMCVFTELCALEAASLDDALAGHPELARVLNLRPVPQFRAFEPKRLVPAVEEEERG